MQMQRKREEAMGTGMEVDGDDVSDHGSIDGESDGGGGDIDDADDDIGMTGKRFGGDDDDADDAETRRDAARAKLNNGVEELAPTIFFSQIPKRVTRGVLASLRLRTGGGDGDGEGGQVAAGVT